METNIQQEAKIRIQRRALRRMNRDHLGTTLSCDTGVLWVTQTGDRKDYILLPGDAMVITGRGTVLVQALRDAAFHVA